MKNLLAKICSFLISISLASCQEKPDLKVQLLVIDDLGIPVEDAVIRTDVLIIGNPAKDSDKTFTRK